MEMKLEANDALQLLVHMMADVLATQRVQGETLAMLMTPNANATATTVVAMRQRIVKERQEILHKIYENYGSIDLNDILDVDPPQE